jgi:hypothetical protein
LPVGTGSSTTSPTSQTSMRPRHTGLVSALDEAFDALRELLERDVGALVHAVPEWGHVHARSPLTSQS